MALEVTAGFDHRHGPTRARAGVLIEDRIDGPPRRTVRCCCFGVRSTSSRWCARTPPRKTVEFRIEGKSDTRTFGLTPGAEVKIHGSWGRLDQLVTGDRAWIWMHKARKGEPSRIFVIAAHGCTSCVWGRLAGGGGGFCHKDSKQHLAVSAAIEGTRRAGLAEELAIPGVLPTAEGSTADS